MLQSHLASLLLKLLGVYCLIYSVAFLSSVLSVRSAMHGEAAYIGGVSASIVISAIWFAVCGVALLAFAKPLANRLASDSVLQEVSRDQDSVRWLELSFMVVGVALVAWETPYSLLQALVNLSAWRNAAPESVESERALNGALFLLALTLLRIAIGAVLVCGGNRIASAVLKLRGLREQAS